MHITAVPALAKTLSESGDPYQHLLPLLAHSTNPEDPIPLLASGPLAKIMASVKDESPATIKKALPMLFSYLASLTRNSDAQLQDIGVQEFSTLLYGKASRQQFWEQRSETVTPLVDILRSAAGISNGDSSASSWRDNTSTLRSGFEGALGGGVGLQLLYHVLLVMWQLSFEAETIGDELNEYVQLPIASNTQECLITNLRL